MESLPPTDLPGSGVQVSDIVGMADDPSRIGYWLTGADGGVFAFGNAPYDGSVPGLGLRVSDIVGIAESDSPSGSGYLLVGADGGVFAFGGAFWTRDQYQVLVSTRRGSSACRSERTTQATGWPPLTEGFSLAEMHRSMGQCRDRVSRCLTSSASPGTPTARATGW